VAGCEGKDFVSRRDVAIIRLFPDTGIRLTEMAGLQVNDLDLELGRGDDGSWRYTIAVLDIEANEARRSSPGCCGGMCAPATG
jgi:hypothetical protein